MERYSGDDVGSTAGDGGAGVCLVAPSSSAGCAVACEDVQTAQMKPPSPS